MPKWRTKLYQTDRARDFDHEKDRQVRARQVYETIDRQRFQWLVVLVAGAGFFLDGYTLFAGNIATPLIAYVYWNNSESHDNLTWINLATLSGTVLGQILFGVLADRKGRKRMYGVELTILIAATFGVVTASNGEHESMNVFGWLVAWRFICGIGVGADYPLSAVITSEFAPTAQRARMLATVFFMQPLGQTASTIVTMIVIAITRHVVGESADTTRAADIMWRWTIGIGVIPGVIAILFRLAIPESPRFMLEIDQDPVTAEGDATALFGEMGDEEDLVSPISNELETSTWRLDTKSASTLPQRPTLIIPSDFSPSDGFYYDDITALDSFPDNRHVSAITATEWTFAGPQPPTLNSKWPVIRADLRQYFIKERNWITLLCTSLAWFLLDFAFYGVGLSSPHWLAKTWGDLHVTGRSPPWEITDDPTASIFDQFMDTSIHALVILNLGSLIGSGLLILTVNHLNRVKLQRYMFLVLASIFVAMGGTFLSDNSHRQGPLAVSLYVIAQIAFNFGPNATTFILPAELFPTRYRATCHGISAAVGKIGSMLMQVISVAAAHAWRKRMEETQSQGQSAPVFNKDARGIRYGEILIGFSGAMILGFVVSLWIPDVQAKIETKQTKREDRDGRQGVFGRVGSKIDGAFRKRLRNKTLEELALGRAGSRSADANRARSSIW